MRPPRAARETEVMTNPRPALRFGVGSLLAAGVAGLVLGVGVAVAGGYVLLTYADNPMADEWQCSEGEAPADHRSGGAACFEEGAELPKGYEWDPLGNRPLSYNCDKDGWVQIEQIRGVGDMDCIAEGTEVPRGWQVISD